MSETLKFTVLGTVQAKQSAKFRNVGKFIQSYQPSKVINYANSLCKSFRTTTQ